MILNDTTFGGWNDYNNQRFKVQANKASLTGSFSIAIRHRISCRFEDVDTKPSGLRSPQVRRSVGVLKRPKYDAR